MSSTKPAILILHGGNTFKDYNAYFTDLIHKKLDFPRAGTPQPDWKSIIHSELPEYEVIQPTLPCKQNAKYSEWEIWFEKFLPFLPERVILVGHSLGGTFLLKYVSENILAKTIIALVLVAPAVAAPEHEDLADFTCEYQFEQIQKRCQQIIIFHSTDDQIVPYEQSVFLQQRLPQAKLVTLQNRNHIWQKTFPELVSELKTTLKHT